MWWESKSISIFTIFYHKFTIYAQHILTCLFTSSTFVALIPLTITWGLLNTVWLTHDQAVGAAQEVEIGDLKVTSAPLGAAWLYKLSLTRLRTNVLKNWLVWLWLMKIPSQNLSYYCWGWRRCWLLRKVQFHSNLCSRLCSSPIPNQWWASQLPWCPRS